MDFFNISSGSPDKVVAAIFGLVGVLFTSSVSLLGLLLKRHLEIKNLALQKEAEDRFRMDTALKAIELMNPNVKDAHNLQEKREGALIAIVTLREYDLSLNLMEPLWEKEAISTNVAIHIIDQALLSDDIRIQNKAADILDHHNEKLPSDAGGFMFPDSVYLKWNKALSSSAKDSIFTALMECMLSKEKDFWKSHSLNQFLYCLYKIMEDKEYLRTSIAAALCSKSLIKVLDPFGLDSGFCPPDQDQIRYSQILNSANEIAPNIESCYEKTTQSNYNLSVKIEEWQEDDWFETMSDEELSRYEI